MYGGRGYGGGGGKKVRALYQYVGETPQDLSFRPGDIITVTNEVTRDGPNFWEGELHGRRGNFPVNHVEVLAGGGDGGFGGGGGVGGSSYPTPVQAPAYTAPSYSSSPIPLQTFSTPAAPAAQTTQPEPSRSYGSGGGGSSDRKLLFAFVLAILILLMLVVSLIIPWYVQSSGGTARIRVFQWTGITTYNPDQVGQIFPPVSMGLNFRRYKSLGYTDVSNLYTVTLSFLLFAGVLSIALVGATYKHKKGSDAVSKKVLLWIAGIMLVSLLVAFFHFFRMPSVYKKNVEPGCVVGPCVKFSGNLATAFWGPSIGWICALFAIAFDLLYITLIALMIRADG